MTPWSDVIWYNTLNIGYGCWWRSKILANPCWACDCGKRIAALGRERNVLFAIADRHLLERVSQHSRASWCGDGFEHGRTWCWHFPRQLAHFIDWDNGGYNDPLWDHFWLYNFHCWCRERIDETCGGMSLCSLQCWPVAGPLRILPSIARHCPQLVERILRIRVSMELLESFCWYDTQWLTKNIKDVTIQRKTT